MRKLSACLVAAAVSSTAFASEPLFKFKNKSYTNEDLDPKTQLRLFDAEVSHYGVQERVIDDAILDVYFADIAKKEKKTADQVRSEKLKIAEPTEKELQKFYDENKQRIPYPFQQVKNELTRYVKEKNASEARQKLVEKAKKEGGFAMLVKEPVAPQIKINTEGFASRGKDDAKVTLVEFADYKCGHCRDASKALKPLFKKYDGKVKFVFIDFPIITGSQRIAEGAFCAKQQDKYWEYHTAAFDEQGKTDNPEDIAKKVKLDEKKFKECLGGKDAAALVNKGKEEGERLGVTGTPSMYINGRKVVSGYTEQALTKEIEKALKTANAS